MIGLERQLTGVKAGKKRSLRLWIASLAGIAVVSLLGAWSARQFLTPSSELSDGEYHWRQANEAIAAREFPQAIAHLEQCLESWPFSAETHLLLARTCRRANRLSDWKKHVQGAFVLGCSKDQFDLELQLHRAQVGDIWRVEDALLDRLNDRSPDQIIILEALVNGLMANDRLADVKFITTKWIEEFPDDWLPLIYRGNAHLRLNGKTEEVVQDFRRVLELKPHEVESHLSLAIVLANNSNVRGALPHFQACLDSLPDDARVLFGLAYCQYSLGQSQEAHDALKQLLTKHQDHAAGLFLQAKIELAEGKPGEAYQWLIKADRIQPQEADVTTALLQVCGQLGKNEKVEKYQRLLDEIHARNAELDRLVTAIKSRPDDIGLRFQLGMACLKLGRDQEASHWFQGILWKQPNHLPTLTALADHYQAKGNHKMANLYRQRAEKARGKGISQSPDSPRK